MEDFAAPNIPAVKVRTPSDLPNQHHVAIVSASGDPTVPPRGSSSLSMARRPVIPPRKSSISLRRMLECTLPPHRHDILAILDDIPENTGRGGGESSGSNNNQVRFQRVHEGAGGGGGRSNMDWDTFAAGSSHHLDLADGLERTESLRPFPDLTIKAADNKDNDSPTKDTSGGGRCTSSASTASGGRSMSRASSDRRSKGKGKDKGKGKAKAARSRSIASSGCADDDEEISTPMLPLHYMESADTEPRTPMAAMPSSGLHVHRSEPQSEPRSEDGLPVTPR